MASSGSSAIPDSLKVVRPFMLVAKDYDRRDPVIAYFCRMYAVQTGVQTDSKSEDAKKYLFSLMDQLEADKKTLKSANSEALTNDVVASAHVENCAHNLFLWADTEDRKGVANKNVVKSFHTAGILFDVLQQFGDLTEEVVQNKKYAKWKATYIHGCLKRGEIPKPGPAGGEEDGLGAPMPHPSSLQPMPPANQPPPSQQPGYPPPGGAYPPGAAAAAPYPPPQHPAVNQLGPGVPPGVHAPPSTPDQGVYQAGMPGPSASNEGGVQLQSSDYTKAQKYCKFASSALQYEDVPTAIDNLEKALRLLKTGRE